MNRNDIRLLYSIAKSSRIRVGCQDAYLIIPIDQASGVVIHMHNIELNEIDFGSIMSVTFIIESILRLQASSYVGVNDFDGR
jgi:hypothetical protein